MPSPGVPVSPRKELVHTSGTLVFVALVQRTNPLTDWPGGQWAYVQVQLYDTKETTLNWL